MERIRMGRKRRRRKEENEQ
ncbi:hypothetical protein E2C01_087557 [Portunus trituberculatus]|uniref:Uncharacterized protein n=1 Tax=Portunus trituberculatus TaxID=210409 RepID=A0A5B7JGP5_PORTR|nr:hypothetical protein [Portunus trituberculatus]